jgi:hypothetical protein
MSSDPGELEPREASPIFELPQVKSVETRRTQFIPRRRNFRSALPEVDNAVEFVVATDSSIPARALGPVLVVGETVLTEVAADDDTHYRFVALEPEALEPGAPISLGWSGRPPAESIPTGFRFELPAPSPEEK